MPKQKITKKEKRIFWAGVSAGVVGGLLGNIWAGYFFELGNNPNLTNFWGVIIFTVILLGVLFLVNKQIKNNL